MNIEQTKVLQALSAGQIQSAALMIKRHVKRWGHYSSEEFTAEVLAGMVAAGWLKRVEITKRLTQYSATTAGLAELQGPPAAAPQEVTPPRTIAFKSWDGIMQWDVASQRGDHRHIGSLG